MQLFELAEIEQTVGLGGSEYGMSSCISGNNGRVLILNVGRHYAIEIQRSNSFIVANESFRILRKHILPDVRFPEVFSLIKWKVI